MMFAGSGADASPRTALKAASCSAKDRLALKKRNGFSTSQIRSAAWLEPAPRLANSDTAQAAARACPRIHPSQTPSVAILALRRGRWRGKFHLVEQCEMSSLTLTYLPEIHRKYCRGRRWLRRRRGSPRGRL